jgi:hypothetical protein
MEHIMQVASTLMENYQSLFFNENFCESASEPGWQAYRGEFVLAEGEVADAQGRRKPPQSVLKQVVLLTSADKVKLLAGSLDELQELPLVVEKFGDALDADALAVLFTVNIDDPFIDTINGAKVVFVPLVQGMVWNELADLAALEKSDFKGQSAADKVVTLFEALKSTKFKYPEQAAASVTTNSNKRENHGAI